MPLNLCVEFVYLRAIALLEGQVCRINQNLKGQSAKGVRPLTDSSELQEEENPVLREEYSKNWSCLHVAWSASR